MRELLRRSQRHIDYRTTFASPAGKRVLAHLVRQFGHFDRSTLTAGDPQATAFREGQRYVVCCLLRQLGRLPVGPDDLPPFAEEIYSDE